MIAEQFPHSVPGWLTRMTQEEVSYRPFAEDSSDLIDPVGYADPLDTKPERVALAAIIGVRAYQRARKLLNNDRNTLSDPHLSVISNLSVPHAIKIQLLAMKSQAIGEAFSVAMADSLLKDEAHLRFLAPDLPAPSVYHRLNSILTPHNDTLLENIPSAETRAELTHTSPVFFDVYAGVNALPQNIHHLLEVSVEMHATRHRNLPDLRTILSITEASFNTFIVPMASLHKADANLLSAFEIELKRKSGARIVELHRGSIRFLPEALQRVREAEKRNRSRTTRCPFLSSTKNMQAFLDEPADFDNPLRDAFDLHMGFLAA